MKPEPSWCHDIFAVELQTATEFSSFPIFFSLTVLASAATKSLFLTVAVTQIDESDGHLTIFDNFPNEDSYSGLNRL
jgi:hypothetical protein